MKDVDGELLSGIGRELLADGEVGTKDGLGVELSFWFVGEVGGVGGLRVEDEEVEEVEEVAEGEFAFEEPKLEVLRVGW